MKKGVGIIIGILFGLNIALVSFIFLSLTGVVDISFGKNNLKTLEYKSDIDEVKEEEDKISDLDEKSLLNVTYKDDVFEKTVNNNTLRNVRNLPIITSSDNQNVADKIVNYLTSVSDENWEQANKEDDMLEVLGGGATIGVSYLFSTVVNNENLLSIDYKLSGGMGGVSWVGYWGYNFNVKTGDILSIRDVLKNGDIVNLSQFVINEIESDYAGESNLWQQDNSSGYWKDIANKNMFSLGNWIITDKGITVTFDKYLLGPGSSGVIEVEIPKDFANKYLKDEYKIN